MVTPNRVAPFFLQAPTWGWSSLHKAEAAQGPVRSKNLVRVTGLCFYQQEASAEKPWLKNAMRQACPDHKEQSLPMAACLTLGCTPMTETPPRPEEPAPGPKLQTPISNRRGPGLDDASTVGRVTQGFASGVSGYTSWP